MSEQPEASGSDAVSRRTVLAIGGAAIAGVTVGASAGYAVSTFTGAGGGDEGAVGERRVSFFGEHQPGIVEPPQAKGVFVAFNLRPEADRESVARLLRVWTSDISLLMSGRGAMADSNAEIAETPAGLTVTVGLGHSAFVCAGLPYEWPVAVAEIPAYKQIDALEPQWVGGDLLLQVCADDSLTVAHAVRELTKTALPFATVHWQQSGFMPHAGVNPGETARNLMGQIDGSANPAPDSAVFEYTVWNKGDRHAWFKGGTTMAFRRIRMQLDTWEKLKPADQELVVGRNRRNGAPLTGQVEKDLPDYDAKLNGKPVIPVDAHIRRASFEEKILRRPFSYDDGYTAEGVNDVGLLFVSFQAEIQQYLQMQASLAEMDSLNKWTVPVGSALFAILPGCAEGEWLGQAVFG